MDMSEQVTSRMMNLDIITLQEAVSEARVIHLEPICDALREEDYTQAGEHLARVVRDFVEKEERKWAE